MANPSAAKLRRKDKRPREDFSPVSEQSLNDKPDVDDENVSSLASLVIHSSPPPPMATVRLLIASLGNPPPHQSTRHSAGHILLRALASSLSFPSLARNKSYANAAISTSLDHPQYTLYHSPTQMNISGPTLLKAWNHFTSLHARTATTALVVLHDELESLPGKLKTRRGDGSAKGHNGIKSVQASLQGAGLLNKLSAEGRFVKIGVGIGRPLSRDQDDVSNYVLGEIPGAERRRIETNGVEELGRLLSKEVDTLGRV